MQKTTLDNGLRVIVDENHASKVVAAQVWVQVGSADEIGDDAGLAHVHEHMLFKGTARRRVGEIAAHVEAAGGDINAWTSFDQTVYHIAMPSREVDTALDILADAVQHSAFDADELARELEVVLEELRRGKDTPSRVASEMLFSTAFSKHTYGRPVIGYQETVEKFTRDQILAFYRRWYQPRNMVLVVSGDVSAQHVLELAGELFEEDLNAGPAPERAREVEPAQHELRVKLDAQDIQETHLGLAWHGPALHDEDTPALDVLSVLLGMGESSRLYRRVKREQQLVNDCYGFAYTPTDPGLLVVGAQIHGPRIEDAYRALLTETLRLKFEAPEQAEVEKAKTIIMSDAIYSKETVQGMARKLGYFELVAGGAEFEEAYYEKVRKITPADVRRVAEKYLRIDGLSVTALTPTEHASRVSEAGLERITGEVETDLRAQHVEERVEPGALGVAKVTLANGATLLVQEDDSVPLVSVRAAAMGGLLAETDADNGVTHLAGELLVRGTERYSAEQIVEECDAMASGIVGVSGRNSLGVRGDFLRDGWERGFELFSSCLLEATFAEDEVEKERQTALEDIAARKDSLPTVAFEGFLKALYGEHPYHMPTIGTEESVKGLTRDQLLAAYRTQLRPDRLTLCVVGQVDVPQVIRMVERRIGSVAAHPDAGAFERPGPPVPLTGPQSVLEARDKQQAHMVLGFLGVRMNDPARPALEVLASVLGGQSGRLFLELRDRQSLAYAVSAFSLEGVDPGYFCVYIGTAPEKLEQAERGFRAELQKVLDEEITAEELSRARRYLVGSHEISLQRKASRAGAMALNEAYGLGYDEHARYASRIEAVTAAEVREVAQRVIRFDAAVRSVIAPAKP